MLGIFMVLLALLVTLARFGLPWVQEQRQALLNQLLPPQSFHTRAERLGLTWIDAGPALSLQGLELEPSTAAAWRLQVGEAKLQLAPWQSLLQRRWVVERLQLQKDAPELAGYPVKRGRGKQRENRTGLAADCRAVSGWHPGHRATGLCRSGDIAAR